jgi:hypothetical protein
LDGDAGCAVAVDDVGDTGAEKEQAEANGGRDPDAGRHEADEEPDGAGQLQGADDAVLADAEAQVPGPPSAWPGRR